MLREAIERDEFRTPVSPETLRVFQVTTDAKRDSHVDSQNAIRWTPDSKRFVFKREASDDGRPAGTWLCDVDDGFSIRAICEYQWKPDGLMPKQGSGETYAWQMIPDGSGLYEIRHAADKMELCRVAMASGKAETLFSFPAPIATRWMDVSADGERVVYGVFLGDGKTEGAPWGVRVFDVKNGKTWVVEMGNECHLSPPASRRN